MPMNMVVLVSIPPQGMYYRKAISEKYPDLNLKVFTDREEAKAALAEADILMAFGASLKRISSNMHRG
jgi:hypothetical protein